LGYNIRHSPQSVAKMGARNLLTTKTAIAIYIAILPTVASITIRYLPRATQDIKDLSDIAAKVLMIVGGAGALAGRYGATDDVYTPSGLPGRDKDEAEAAAELSEGANR
jgi:hypothetical protein